MLTLVMTDGRLTNGGSLRPFWTSQRQARIRGRDRWPWWIILRDTDVGAPTCGHSSLTCTNKPKITSNSCRI